MRWWRGSLPPISAAPRRGRRALPARRRRPPTTIPSRTCSSAGFPSYYLGVLLAVLLCALVSVRAVAGPLGALRPYADLFFMGAAFLLLETRYVTGFALLFGSTWLVNALVFAGVLLAVLCAVETSRRLRPRALTPLYVLLAATLVVAYVVPLSALLSLDLPLRLPAAIALAFAPIFCANLIFAARFADTSGSTAAFGANLLGALLGGSARVRLAARGLPRADPVGGRAVPGGVRAQAPSCADRGVTVRPSAAPNTTKHATTAVASMPAVTSAPLAVACSPWSRTNAAAAATNAVTGTRMRLSTVGTGRRRSPAKIRERRADGGRARAVEPAGKRPHAEHGDQRDADKKRASEEHARGPLTRDRSSGGEHRHAGGRKRDTVATGEQHRVGGGHRRPPQDECLQQRDSPADGRELRSDEEDDRPRHGRLGPRRRGMDQRERRASRREHARDGGDGGPHTTTRRDLGIQRRRDLRGRAEGAHRRLLSPLGRGVDEMIAALAQEPPSHAAADVQRGAELLEVALDRAHAVPPSTRSTTAENARHSSRESLAARRPFGVNR